MLLPQADCAALEEMAAGLRGELAVRRSELAAEQQAAAEQRGAAAAAAQSLGQQCERQAAQVASLRSRLQGLQAQVTERDKQGAELARQLAGRDEALDKLRCQLRDMNDLVAALKRAGLEQVGWRQPRNELAVGRAVEPCVVPLCWPVHLYTVAEISEQVGPTQVATSCPPCRPPAWIRWRRTQRRRPKRLPPSASS